MNLSVLFVYLSIEHNAFVVSGVVNKCSGLAKCGRHIVCLSDNYSKSFLNVVSLMALSNPDSFLLAIEYYFKIWVNVLDWRHIFLFRFNLPDQYDKSAGITL